MLRSEVNKNIREAMDFFQANNFKLPFFAYLTPEEWDEKKADYENITKYSLGWDLTDFGSGNFNETGLLLFTIRNGHYDEPESKKYAEKIMLVKENQVTPYHFHWKKKEDIINRSGGKLILKLYKSDAEEDFSDDDFTVVSDGRVIECQPGHEVTLDPGESITLDPYIYHSFWALDGHGDVMVGEVSETSDDNQDNRFYDNQPRFTEITEDEPKEFVLVNEY